ncbi:MAG: hypothetical protein AAFQ82_11660 [Myxococcota bacterium]
MGEKCINSIREPDIRELARQADGAEGEDSDGYLDTTELRANPELMDRVEQLPKAHRDFPRGMDRRPGNPDPNGDGVSTYAEARALQQPEYDIGVMMRMSHAMSGGFNSPMPSRTYLPFGPRDPAIKNQAEIASGHQLEQDLDGAETRRVVQGGLESEIDDCDIALS